MVVLGHVLAPKAMLVCDMKIFFWVFVLKKFTLKFHITYLYIFSGLIYCCVGFLSVCGRLDALRADELGWWLCERQLPNGGLNGRPEKLPDLCYSW